MAKTPNRLFFIGRHTTSGSPEWGRDYISSGLSRRRLTAKTACRAVAVYGGGGACPPALQGGGGHFEVSTRSDETVMRSSVAVLVRKPFAATLWSVHPAGGPNTCCRR